MLYVVCIVLHSLAMRSTRTGPTRQLISPLALALRYLISHMPKCQTLEATRLRDAVSPSQRDNHCRTPAPRRCLLAPTTHRCPARRPPPRHHVTTCDVISLSPSFKFQHRIKLFGVPLLCLLCVCVPMFESNVVALSR
jgi:hypothetical protein